MFDGTTAWSQARVSLPAGRLGRDLLLPFTWREFYFAFFYAKHTFYDQGGGDICRRALSYH